MAILGHPLAHSLSPAIHGAAFAHHRLDWTYERIEVEPAALPQALDRLRNPDWAGANVTLPHKVAVMDLLDSLEPTAAACGAVNTIVNRQGRLEGWNTDGAGFAHDLRQLGVEVDGRPVLLLGAGGAARAAAWSLAEAAASVVVVARSPARAERWINDLWPTMGDRPTVSPWVASSFERCAPGTLIVNATPVGMWPHAERSPWPQEAALPPEAIVYDMVYRPPETVLIRTAREAGLTAHGGLGMLVEQAALSYEQWTGRPGPRAVMRAAAAAELEVA